MYRRLKISPHEHSGRLLPHHHTSYAGLAFALMVLGVVLAAVSWTASAAGPHPPPQSGYIGLSGTVPAAPPATAAVITKPSSGQHFGTTPVTIAGTCPKNTLVEIYKNEIFAGATPCTDSGTFSVDVDLLIGSNTLVARVYDALNQAGPDSNKVEVSYDALPPQTDPLTVNSFSSLQLLLKTSAAYRGVFPDQDLTVPISILGGTAPFAVNVEWGDNNNTLLTRNDNLDFETHHAYKKAGTYAITIQATDAQQRVAFLTVVAIINGKPEVLSANSASPTVTKNQLVVVWPLFAIVITMVVSFWLGERREKHVLERQMTV